MSVDEPCILGTKRRKARKIQIASNDTVSPELLADPRVNEPAQVGATSLADILLYITDECRDESDATLAPIRSGTSRFYHKGRPLGALLIDYALKVKRQGFYHILREVVLSNLSTDEENVTLVEYRYRVMMNKLLFSGNGVTECNDRIITMLCLNAELLQAAGPQGWGRIGNILKWVNYTKLYDEQGYAIALSRHIEMWVTQYTALTDPQQIININADIFEGLEMNSYFKSSMESQVADNINTNHFLYSFFCDSMSGNEHGAKDEILEMYAKRYRHFKDSNLHKVVRFMCNQVSRTPAYTAICKHLDKLIEKPTETASPMIFKIILNRYFLPGTQPILYDHIIAVILLAIYLMNKTIDYHDGSIGRALLYHQEGSGVLTKTKFTTLVVGNGWKRLEELDLASLEKRGSFHLLPQSLSAFLRVKLEDLSRPFKLSEGSLTQTEPFWDPPVSIEVRLKKKKKVAMGAAKQKPLKKSSQTRIIIPGDNPGIREDAQSTRIAAATKESASETKCTPKRVKTGSASTPACTARKWEPDPFIGVGTFAEDDVSPTANDPEQSKHQSDDSDYLESLSRSINSSGDMELFEGFTGSKN